MNSQSPLLLPPFTLLCGPRGAGKTTLAALLQSQDDGLCPMSFAEPIRLALLATFHPEEIPLGIDLRDPDVQARSIPGTGVTYDSWMRTYARWLKDVHSPYILCDLAKRNLEAQEQYYSRFVFDDCRTLEDLAGLTNAYGVDSVLLVYLEREPDLTAPHAPTGGHSLAGPSTPIPGVSRAVVRNNGSPPDMLTQLAAIVGRANTPPAPPPLPRHADL